MRPGVRPCWRRAGLGGLLLAACLPSLQAAAPPPPALVALRAVADLERQIDRQAVASRFDEAEKLARAAVAERRRWQGEKHWQTVDARREAERWQRLVRLSAEDRAAVGRAYRLLDRGALLQRQGRTAEAERAAREAILLCRRVLEPDDLLSARAHHTLAAVLY